MRAAIFERLSDRRVLAAEVVTDLQDYAPGQTAVITAWNSDREGMGYVVGEPFRFQVTRTDGIPDFPQGNLPWFVTDGVGGFDGYYVDSDSDGTLDYGVFPDNDGTANAAVSTTWYVEPQYGDSTLRLHTEGQQSGAVATHDFTDSVAGLSIISPSNTAPITVTAGETFTITYDVSLSDTNGNNSQIIISQIATATLSVTGSDSIPLDGTDNIGNLFGTYTGRSFVVTVPNTTTIDAGTYKLNVTVTQTFQDDSTQSRTASANNSVIINAPTNAISSLTVGAQAGAAVYGGATDSVTFTVAANRGTNGNINGTYGFTGLPTGVTGALSVTAFTVTGSTAPPSSVLTLQVSATVPAGSYPFTVTCLVGGATVTSSGVLLVNRAPLTVTASNVNKTYGNAFTFDNTAPGDFAVSTLFNSDTVSTVTLSSTGAVANASVLSSPYPISVENADGAGLSNYDITYVAGTLTVDVRLISYEIGDGSIVYGSTTTFAGLPSTFATDVGSETLSITYDSTGNSGTANVGEYAITGTVGDGTGLAANYAVTLIDGTLMVGRRAIAYTIGSLSKDEGIAVNLASLLPGTIATGVGGQTLSITYASAGAAANALANTYPITGSIGDGTDGGLAANYDVTLTPGELKVVARYLILGVDANSFTAPYVQVFNAATGTGVSKFLAYESSFRGGVRVTRADLTGDGVDEIITAPGRGRAPEVRVFSLTGVPLPAYTTMAYATSMINGIQIAVGDVNGDGSADLVTVPSRGAAEVRVFLNQRGTNVDPMANNPSRTFLAFPSSFIGGAVLALADMGRTNGTAFVPSPDGKMEILVGSGAGMRATVRIFDAVPATPVLVRTILPFASKFQGGIASLAVGRANSDDAIPDVIAGAANGGNAMVEVRDGQTSALLSAFTAYTDASRQSPVRAVVRDTNNDGVIDEIWTAQGTDGRTRQLKRFRVDGTAVDSLLESDVSFRGEYFLA